MYGIHCFQIHIHRDEGHNMRRKINWNNPQWKPNFHAHLLFDYTDQKTGESLRRKITRNHTAEMQTITAKILDMERGEFNSKAKRKNTKEQHLFGIEKDIQMAKEVLSEQRMKVEKAKEIVELIEELTIAVSQDIPYNTTIGDYRLTFREKISLWIGNKIDLFDILMKSGERTAHIVAEWTKKKGIRLLDPLKVQAKQEKSEDTTMKRAFEKLQNQKPQPKMGR
jgi:hypothetical protein